MSRGSNPNHGDRPNNFGIFVILGELADEDIIILYRYFS